MKQLFYLIRKKVYNLSTYFGYKYNLNIYDEKFFITNREEGLKMGEWFIPLLKGVFNLKSLIDVGCGTGHYLYHCIKNNIYDVFGLEGSQNAWPLLLVDKKLIKLHDLRKPIFLNKKWDLALSIEVAEHIDKRFVNNYLNILCNHADTIVLTAAPPKQGGTAHVNERPKDWWINKFAKNNYYYNEDLTVKLKEGIKHAKNNGKFVTFWFEPNIMVFNKNKI